LTHPKFKLPKTYEVTLDREFDFEEADCLRRGINLEDGRARIDAIFRLNPRVLKVVLTQGLKRQIRLMFHAVGYNVERLVRTQVGQMKLGTLPAGQWKMIDDAEIATLLQPAPERTRSIRDLPGEKAGAAKRADRGPERSGGYRSSSRPPSSRGPRSTSRYSSPRTKSFRGDRPEYQGSSQRRAHRRPSDGSHAQSERPPSWVSRRPSEPRKRTGERPLEGSESRPPRTGPWKTRRPGGPRRQTGRHYLAEPRSRPQETRRGPSKRFAGHQRGRKGQGTQRRSSRGE
jgi:23S rRNA pseudouridine2605 synthase